MLRYRLSQAIMIIRKSLVKLQLIIFEVFLKHIRTECKITCDGKNDGGGAQVHAKLSVQVLAKEYGIDYVYTPFKSIEHRPDDTSPSDWLRKWENFFELGKNYETNKNQYPTVYANSLFRGLCLILKNKNKRILVAIPHAHLYADAFPENYSKYIADNHSNVFCINKPKNDALISVAVHVRRGDVTSDNTLNYRYTSSDKVINYLKMIKHEYPDKEINVIIYSNSYCPKLDSINFINCRLDLDSDVFEVLNGLIQADILIMAKSSLSYVAALYSKSDIYYESFWHSPLPHWKRLEGVRRR